MYFCHKCFNTDLEDHVFNARRHLVQNTKKMDCPAQITVSQVMTCPGFKIAENSKAKRRELSAALKAVVAADPSTVEVVMEYHTCFTPESDHQNHPTVGEEAMDSRVEQQIVKLTLAGVRKLSEIRRHLFNLVNDELFRGEQPPPRTRRRFYPTDKDIRNILSRTKEGIRESKNDQVNLQLLTPRWLVDDCKIKYRPSQLQEDGTVTKLLFCYQTAWQRRLLHLYGQQMCLLDATYRTVRQQQMFKEWNPDWSPSHFMVDFSEVEIGALEEEFQEEFGTRLCNLQEANVWKDNDKVRAWFSNKWLPEAKRWVHVFRDEDLKVAIYTNNGVERLNETLKYSHLEGYKNWSLSEMLTVLVTDFLPRTYRKYIELNVKYSTVYRSCVCLPALTQQFYTDQPPVSSPPKHHMDSQNNMENEAKMFLSHAKTLRLHTGNIVNRSRLKKKCPCSPSEELQDCIQAALSDWKAATKPPSNDFPDTLDCSIPQPTDAIPPEEREELRVSGRANPPSETPWRWLDSVIIAPTWPLGEGENQSLANLQPAWEELESLVRSQRIAAIGTSDLDKDLLEQLYTWAQVKPSSNQVNLASCCVMPPDLTAFAKEFDIQLLTHNDPKELMSAATFQEAVLEGKQDLSVAIWRLEWVLRYSIIVKSRGIIKAKGYLVSAVKESQ
ncbi:hypothetical protein JOQ06_006106 [Pogonophryne albipinna]|uniref:Gamma-ECS regulatory subunit n=1 Tax=Pogonophryne albipinna TaxID=1090488 RepID=A0AAD6BHB8_9TELE|nr:hypothetical protein JOQ06_006106 [Pogonophryne albipinna]